MPVSVSEQTAMTCSACGQLFTAEVWVLVDAAERPELAQALRDGTLDHMACPHCGATVIAGAALLFHEPAQRRVSFAVPPHTAEHLWRERAQALLQLLLDRIPAEEQLPYLGDVQVDQEVEGLRRALLRRDKQTRARQVSAARAQSPVELMRAQLAERTGDRQGGEVMGQGSGDDLAGGRWQAAASPISNLQSPILSPPISAEPEMHLAFAVQELLAADTPEQFRAVVAAHPALLSESADAMLAALANAAYEEADRALAEALHTARRSLRAMSHNSGTLEAVPAALRAPQAAPAQPLDGTPTGSAGYDALFRAATSAELVQAVADYPLLLDVTTDAELGTRAELALEEGNERLARQIEERREALLELRAAPLEGSPLMVAVEALLVAEDEAAMARVLDEYPLLLTDAAQDALATLGAGARAQGDTTLADYADECRTLLRNARSAAAL